MVIITRLAIIIKKSSSSLWPTKFAFIIILFSSAIWIGGNITSFSEGQQQSSQILEPSLGVKITSPTAGQTVPIGAGELKILGTSTINNNNNPSSSSSSIGNCYVSVIVNNIKPYQNATAAGPNGINDYSKWIYTLSPQYTTIKEGENKITSKLSCLNNISSGSDINPISNTSSNLTKWYSINVTGVAMQLSSSGAANNNVSNNQTMTTTATTTTSSQSIDKSNNNQTGKEGKPLSISIQSSQNIVNGKGKATIRATAYDVMSGKKVDNAIVKLKVTFPYNATAKEISGYNGQAIYSIDIKPNSNNRNNSFIIVTAQASAPGYIYTAKTMTTMAFNNNSSDNNSNSLSITNNNNNNNKFHGNGDNDNNNNNNFGKSINNLADKIIKDVKKKLKNDGIINIPLE